MPDTKVGKCRAFVAILFVIAVLAALVASMARVAVPVTLPVSGPLKPRAVSTPVLGT